MKEKMMMIFTKEEMSRISENDHTITVDLHGLIVKDAKKLLNNLMALNRDGDDICAIHGYSHGTAIKEMINAELDNPRLVEKKGVKKNYGRTILKIRKAA